MEGTVQKVWVLNLKNLMRVKGWSQRDLERESTKYGAISQKTISSYLKEGAELANPTLNKIEVLASCFGLSAHAMLDPNLNVNDLDKVNNEIIHKSMKMSVTLLSEAKVISNEDAEVFYDNIDDVLDTMAIVLKAEVNNGESLVLEFLSFLNDKSK